MSILRTEQIKHNNTGRTTTNLIDLTEVAKRMSEVTREVAEDEKKENKSNINQT